MYNHFFDLSLSSVQRYLPVANSFSNDDFARFAPSLESSPLGWLFNLPELFRFAPSWGEFYEKYLSTTVEDPVAFDLFIPLWVARQAVPYYDVVISRGGIFVTDAEGVTPASTARVERLLHSLDNDIALSVQRMHKTLLKARIDDKKELFLMWCRIDHYMKDYTRNLLCRNVDSVTTNTLYYLEHYDRLLTYEEHLTQTYLGETVRDNLITWANTPSTELSFTKQEALSSLQRITAELFLEEVVNPEPDTRTMRRLENILCDTLRRTAEIIDYDKTADIAHLFVCRAPHQGNNFFV